MQISENTALFSLLGTYYGGNGTRQFALPDLRGRAPYGSTPSGTGSPPGRDKVLIGEVFGTLPRDVTKVYGGVGLGLNWCIATQGIFPPRD